MNGPPIEYVVADIHGNLRALEQCLYMSGFRPDIDWLITLGDLTDGGPDSAGVIELLISFKNTINVKGNHCRWFEDWLQNGVVNTDWYEQGGKATIDSYLHSKFMYDERHLRFIRSQCKFYIDDLNNRAFVHAGWESEEGLGHEYADRTYYWDRTLWKAAKSSEKTKTILKRTSMYKDVFIGHTSVEKESEFPLKCGNVWNLDTGAGWTGRLTIMKTDTKMFWQSDRAEDLYPVDIQRRKDKRKKDATSGNNNKYAK